jgi:hypothetical protein
MGVELWRPAPRPAQAAQLVTSTTKFYLTVSSRGCGVHRNRKFALYSAPSVNFRVSRRQVPAHFRSVRHR